MTRQTKKLLFCRVTLLSISPLSFPFRFFPLHFTSFFSISLLSFRPFHVDSTSDWGFKSCSRSRPRTRFAIKGDSKGKKTTKREMVRRIWNKFWKHLGKYYLFFKKKKILYRMWLKIINNILEKYLLVGFVNSFNWHG